MKQEAKKQQAANAAAHPANAAFDPHHTFADSAFFQPPFDMTPRHSMMTSGMHMADVMCTEPTYHDSEMEEYSASMNFEPALQDSAELFNSFFGLEDNTHGGFNANIDRSTLSAFSKQFNHSAGAIDAFANPMDHEYVNSATASLLTRESTDDSSFRYSDVYAADEQGVNGSLRPHPSSIASQQAMYADHRNSTASWQSSARESMYRDGVYDNELRACQFSTPQRPGQMMEPVMTGLMIDPSGTLSPAAMHPDSGPWVEASHFAVADGSTEAASETYDMHSLPRSNLSNRSNSSVGALALRRQRRPANLGGAGVMRTVSYTAAMPSAQTMDGSDSTNIRRIKSATGAVNGRLHRIVATNSNPRSPLQVAFEDADVHELARNGSFSSGHGIVMGTVSEADGARGLPTPPQMTPLQGQDDSEMVDGSNSWSGRSSVAHRAPPSSWNYGPRLNDSNYASPPSTPMDQSRQTFLQPGMTPQVLSPCAAPPMWQAPFQAPMEQFQPFMSNTGVHMGEPVGYAMGDEGMAVHYPAPMEAMGGHIITQQAAYPGPYAEMMQLGTPTSMHVSPSKSAGELLIHEYSPREPADPSVMAPKSKPAVPRTYTFTNHGPEHFSSPDTSVSSRMS